MLLTVFLAAFLSQANSYSPEKTCQVVQTKTFIADPSDCSGYYYCVDGAIDFHGNCEKGLLYNSYKAACDYESNVQCNFGKDICKSVASPVYKHDPNSCASYIYCDGKGNTLYNSCPENQDFDLESISCKWKTPDSCAGQACELVPNNKFVAFGQKKDKDGTTLYGSQTCYNGKGSQNWCESGFIYNSKLGQCEYNTVAESKPDCSTQVNNFAASPTNCNQYYYCPPASSTSATDAEDASTPILLSCPQRFHFNAASGTCVYAWLYKPAGANINCDRCGGWTKGYFAVDGSKPGCNNYLFCSAGSGSGATDKAAGTGKCTSAGFPYFSEEQQACVGSEPNSPICK